jgi:hypothetical protein
MRGDQQIPRRNEALLLEMDEEVSRLGQSAPILQSGFLDGSKERWEKAVQALHEMTKSRHF